MGETERSKTSRFLSVLRLKIRSKRVNETESHHEKISRFGTPSATIIPITAPIVLVFIFVHVVLKLFQHARGDDEG